MLKQNQRMKVLIISNIELDTKNASGNTYANWLSNWEDTQIACIYSRGTYPNNDFCDEYFSISPFNIIRNCWKPWNIGRYFTRKEIPQNNSSVSQRERGLIQKSKHQDRRWIYLAIDLLFKSHIWMNRRYKNFVRDFNPDIVFFLQSQMPS